MQTVIINVMLLNIIICKLSVLACTIELIVNTQTGKVKGQKVKGSEGDEFCSFRGIPFAKAPIGHLRFKDPEPAESWTGIRETMTYGPWCIQHDWFSNNVFGEEDCLFLNVFTKSIDAKRPVMVWIHSGGFACGSGDDLTYGPDYFMRKDIVLVTINYRLGIFGFLNLNDEVATGNQGLKDQIMALQWIRDNIENFGGDPNSVTIFGESAGGASTHYLTISSLARGLFHKAIIQSGVTFNPWAYQINSEDLALELSKKLGHEETDAKSVVQFLSKIDAKELLEARKELIPLEDKLQLNFGFVPSIDVKSKNPFMPVHPEIAAVDGIHVPVMIGYTNREGILFTRKVQQLGDQLNEDYVKLLHPNYIDMLKRYGLNIESYKRIYYNDELITQENSDKLIDLLGDYYVVEGTHKVMKIQMQKGLVAPYFYQFTYDKELSPFKMYVRSKLTGASHTDELFYLFRHEALVGKVNFPEKESERYRIMEQMIEMWVNFATTGMPTTSSTDLLPFQWEPINNESSFAYLSICENPRMEIQPSIEFKYTVQ